MGRLGRLEELDVYGNRLGPAGVAALCREVARCTRLRRLSLGLTAAGVATGPLAYRWLARSAAAR